MEQFFTDLLSKYTWLIGLLAILGVEISPIKVNPLSWIASKLGKIMKHFNNAIHKDIYDCQKEILNRLAKMEKDNDFKDVMMLKKDICSYKVKLQTAGLDEDEYARCFEQISQYEFYQTKYPNEVNGHMKEMFVYIRKQYEAGNILPNKNV